MTRSLADWLQHIDRVHPRDIEMGLIRVSRVAASLGIQKPAPRTVIVAGTNGKGSTCIALESLLLAAGRRVGTTLSPHISRFNERIRVAGTELEDSALVELFAAIEQARGDVVLTYFEFSTLAALLAFKNAGVDVAILEVGLGGRLDAFNLVAADLAIVTSIGLDHEDYLGTDLEGIGREKAGVFRRGQPVVLGQVTESVCQAAVELDCPTYLLGREFRVLEQADFWCFESSGSETPGLAGRCLRLPRGSLAPSNCALAIVALELLTGEVSVAVDDLADQVLAGRMESSRYRGVEVISDVAHNPAAATFLAQQLDIRYPSRRYIGVLGMLADKDVAGVVAALGDRVQRWLTIATYGPREQGAGELAIG